MEGLLKNGIKFHFVLIKIDKFINISVKVKHIFIYIFIAK